MNRLFTWLRRRRYPYEPLISVSISRRRLLSNLHEFQLASPGCAIAPVLKSNAYGHGLFEIAGILELAGRSAPPGNGIPFFVVDSYFEAVALRAHRSKMPLLVMGYTRPETILASKLARTSFMVTSLETLRELKDAPHPLSIQLKFDTGMRRQGLVSHEAVEAVALLQSSRSVFLEGICTHFADADNADRAFTDSQIGEWDGIVRQFKVACPDLKYVHAAATDGSRFSDRLGSNVVRLGIGLYGLSQNEELGRKLHLEPVLEMKTILTGVKRLKAGESVGYGATFTAEKDMIIATIPVGYYEGLDRRLSSKGAVQVGANRIACPILGRVSMNITVIDVSAVADACIGLEATVISGAPSDPNSLHSMAKMCGTITYDLAVHIPAHLKRIVTE